LTTPTASKVIGELVADLSQPGQMRSTLRISNLAGIAQLRIWRELYNCALGGKSTMVELAERRSGGDSPMGDLAATSECQIRYPVKWCAAAPFDIWRNRQRAADLFWRPEVTAKFVTVMYLTRQQGCLQSARIGRLGRFEDARLLLYTCA
jgi:hypothetical protein